MVDASGGALLPGLMDGHVHIDDPRQATTLAHWGVTTAFDMGAKDPRVIAGIRDAAGVTTLRTAGYPAGPPSGTHIVRLGYPAVDRHLAGGATRRSGWPVDWPKDRTTSRCCSSPEFPVNPSPSTNARRKRWSTRRMSAAAS